MNNKMKEQIIQIPDTLKIKEIKDGKIILVEKKKKLTYKDICKKLFPYPGNYYYMQADGIGYGNWVSVCPSTSKKQLEKLLAINKLMNVAKYLNDDWKPDFNTEYRTNWCLYISRNNTIEVGWDVMQHVIVYFKTEELARQALDILGEKTIRLALSTDY